MSSPLHDRIHAVVGTRTFRAVADMTRTNPETARRYMSGQEPSVEFLASLCRAANVNGEWLLTGRGPMHRSAVTAEALQEASASELLNAMARSLEKLARRVERLEHYAQMLEARLRVAGQLPDQSSPTRAGEGDYGRQTRPEQSGAQRGSDPDIRVRARAVGDALSERPREDAG